MVGFNERFLKLTVQSETSGTAAALVHHHATQHQQRFKQKSMAEENSILDKVEGQETQAVTGARSDAEAASSGQKSRSTSEPLTPLLFCRWSVLHPARVAVCALLSTSVCVAAEFLLDDPSIADDFEAFAQANCGVFEDSEENKLVYMDVYNKFTELFNARIEAFIVNNGSTLEEFVKLCDKAEEESFALQLIMGITSFEAFKVRAWIDQQSGVITERESKQLSTEARGKRRSAAHCV